MNSQGRIASIIATIIIGGIFGGLRFAGRWAANENREERRAQEAAERKQAERERLNRQIDRRMAEMDRSRFQMPHTTVPAFRNPTINLNPGPSSPPGGYVPPTRTPVTPRTNPAPPPPYDPTIDVQPQPDDNTIAPGTLTLPGSSPAPVVPEVVPRRELVLEHSPLPLDDALDPYAFWAVADGYEQFLDEPTQVNGFSVRSSVEFRKMRQNSREAEWDAPGGTRGVGLDMRVDELLPRDLGLTSPVLEDAEGRQVFRLGRRQERAMGEATITYLDHNGLLIWRITVPASATSELATCYYAAVADNKMVVLTARYDKDKPEQLTGFDAIAGTLAYKP